MHAVLSVTVASATAVAPMRDQCPCASVVCSSLAMQAQNVYSSSAVTVRAGAA